MNSIFLIIFDLDNDLLQVVLVILVVLFSEKNHLHLFALETKKADTEPEKKFNNGFKYTSHMKKKKEGVSTMSKNDSLAMNKKDTTVKKRGGATKKKKYTVKKKKRDTAKKSEVMTKKRKLDGGVHGGPRQI